MSVAPLGVDGLQELVLASQHLTDDSAVLAGAYWEYVIQDLIHRAEQSREIARRRAMAAPSSFTATMEHSAWLTLRDWLADQLDDVTAQAGEAASRPMSTTEDIAVVDGGAT